jgi:ribosomal protein S18 acetylase RimI-like enzyme
VTLVDASRLRLLDELAANASPANHVQPLGGWLLRASDDVPFRRSNSVAVMGPDDPPDLEERLLVAAGFARWHGIRLRFQVSPLLHPGIDAKLGRRGLEVEAPVEVLTAESELVLANARGRHAAMVEVRDDVDGAWPADHAGMDERTAAYMRMLSRAAPPVAHSTATMDGAPAGVGFGVAERGWMGVFGMATAPRFRRRGVAVAVIGAITAWGLERGARDLYLQVERDNHPAQALYRRLGFEAGHGYHYRSEPSPRDQERRRPGGAARGRSSS